MIIVFGSNVLDFFFHTPELPLQDQVVFINDHIEAPGGKGANQAVAAARAGARVYFSGALGKGGHGRQMYDNLIENDVDTSGIRFLKDVSSGLATIFVNAQDGTHRIVVSHGANLKAKQEWIPDHLLNPNSIVLVQGELPITETEALLARAKRSGARTVMNFAPASQKLSDTAFTNIDYLILNEHEADAVAAQQNMQTDNKENLATDLQKKFSITVIITLGALGSVCASDKGVIRVPSFKVDALDTVGAGDAFVGYFTAGLDKALSLEEALKQATIAGSLACTKVGGQASVPMAKDLKPYLQEIEVDAA